MALLLLPYHRANLGFFLFPPNAPTTKSSMQFCGFVMERWGGGDAALWSIGCFVYAAASPHPQERGTKEIKPLLLLLLTPEKERYGNGGCWHASVPRLILPLPPFLSFFPLPPQPPFLFCFVENVIFWNGRGGGSREAAYSALQKRLRRQ